MANIYELGSSFDLIWNLIEGEVMDESELDDAFSNLVLGYPRINKVKGRLRNENHENNLLGCIKRKKTLFVR